MAGKSKFFEESGVQFPKSLVEIHGIPMIQHVIEYLSKLSEKHKFIFVVNKGDVQKYHINNTLKLLTNNDAVIVQQGGATKGAACSCLLSIEYINNDSELVISNSDQKIDCDLDAIVNRFRLEGADAGVLHFESVHPQWSYVRFESGNIVCEAAEKNPISKNAIAGFYYFRKGSFFVESAMSSISKGAEANGLYFIAPTLNEMILKGKKVVSFKIDNTSYHSFYSWEKIKEFEAKL